MRLDVTPLMRCAPAWCVQHRSWLQHTLTLTLTHLDCTGQEALRKGGEAAALLAISAPVATHDVFVGVCEYVCVDPENKRTTCTRAGSYMARMLGTFCEQVCQTGARA
jgi:hypothetical protein